MVMVTIQQLGNIDQVQDGIMSVRTANWIDELISTAEVRACNPKNYELHKTYSPRDACFESLYQCGMA